TVYCNLAGIRTELDVLITKGFIAVMKITTDDGFDSRQQFCQVKGLRQVVVGPDFQSQHLVVNTSFGGQNKYELLARGILQCSQDIKSATTWQHDIEQDTIVIVIHYLVEASVVGCCFLYQKTFALKK